MSNESARTQVSCTISPELHKQLEEISIRTGLSRSRLFDIALVKFVAWSALVDEVAIRRLSADLAPKLGYVRRDSGFRRSASGAPPSVRPGLAKTDPYYVPSPPVSKPLPKVAANGKK